jgi:hypothetical protein
MWHNHIGEIGHCYGQLETLMREALQDNAVHICFARASRPQDLEKESKS